MIKDIFLPMTATPGDDDALTHAIAMASRFQAHLTVLEPVSLPQPTIDPWGLTPEPSMLAIYDELRETGNRNAAKLRTRLEKEGISWEVRLEESMLQEPSHLAALQARYADLSVVGVANPDNEPSRMAQRYFEALLFESGRPVLMVPSHAAIQSAAQHVVVAWHPSQEAARAVNDALPLMSAAASVDVVRIRERPGEAEGEEDPDLRAISLHLARHDLDVNMVSKPLIVESVALTLLRHCRESGAQLLVAGGYGHSRAREWLLGGATRTLLRAAHLPVLFAH
ncbi:universal stress protein [Pseudoxanthomonas sp. SE1]|uniref:universal stress protein n=1 Tax=Pseudoxanthomonas sp. SE1 TaxID=1664560 RepID=UPI00240DACEA|nr:universal stress protein [Pseudoxanthomonas sp. SE1]WFC41549.1 universal stress protein [Pseudoxanthomonas sp. SE1]